MYSDDDDPQGAGFPHSEIRGSKFARNSPRLIATCYVLHRLSMPRHPPNALKALDSAKSVTCREKTRSPQLTVPHQYQTTNHKPHLSPGGNPPNRSKSRARSLFSQPIHNVKERKITKRMFQPEIQERKTSLRPGIGSPASAHWRSPGGADRNRTGDLLLAKQALSRLSYSPNIQRP